MLTGRIITQDLASPKLRAMLAQLAPAQRQAMLNRLGKALENQLKAHFVTRDAEGNKQGFPSQHFWSREVRNKTALREVTPDRATVGIDSAPFRQKVFGGVIRPGPGKKFLALPTRAEAYGVLPRANTIPGLFAVRVKSTGKAYLATRDGKALRVYWRLVTSVNQAPDPKALPPRAQLQAALDAIAEREIVRIAKP
jgi:hypothetical protein